MVDVSNLKIEMEDPASAAAPTVVEPHNEADEEEGYVFFAGTPSTPVTTARAAALLKSLIFADDGWAMTPSVTLKNGKYYRYYVNTASNLHMVDGKARLVR